MLRSQDLADTYRDGAFLHRWCLVGGYPRCIEDAYPVADTPAEVVAAQIATNALVRETVAAVEVYEGALRLTAGDPPEQWATVYDPEGHAEQVESAAWAAYQQALATVAGATDLTRAYATIRAGRPEDPAPDAEPSPEWLAYAEALALIEGAAHG